MKDTCPYSVIFESSPPEGAEALRNYEHVPRPFVLEPPLTTRTEFQPGEKFSFGLVLIGRGIEYLPYFIVTLRELGRNGLGKGRGRFELKSVWGLKAFDAIGGIHGATYCEALPEAASCELRHSGNDGAGSRYTVGAMPEAASSGRVLVYDGDSGRVWNHDVSNSSAMGFQAAGDLSSRGEDGGLRKGVRKLSIEFETMTRLKYGGQLVEVPEFHVLMRGLTRRVSSLLYFHHGGERLAMNFADFFSRAERVRLTSNKTRWVDWERFSSRQGTKMKLGGIVGEANFEGELEEFLPWLIVGQYIHVGKGTTFGLGKYRIASLSS